MRACTKTITFDFKFDYPANGQYLQADSITVCEPGFDHRDVFRRMGGFVANAQKGLLKTFSGMSKDEIEKDVEAESEPAAADKPDVDTDPLMTMRLGLSIDEYEQFLKFVERVLTSNKMLAYVGADAENKVPVTEEVWRNIAQEGGLHQMERVHASFASFFLDTPQASTASATTSGTAKPSGSGSTRAGRSPTTKH